MKNKHMNGGIAVDTWGRSNVTGIYAVGEAAGTHGATRPGGSALNAGQVFGTRVAEHIAASGRAQVAIDANANAQTQMAVMNINVVLNADSTHRLQDIRAEVQAWMSDHAGILCNSKDVAQARQQAEELNEKFDAKASASPAQTRLGA